MARQGRLKICVGASAGGHTNELLALLRASGGWPAGPAVYVTTLAMLAEKFAGRGRVYVIGECDRRRPLKAVGVFLRALRCVAKEKPDVVITTGSLPLAIMCLLARLFGARIAWIDSIANTEDLSLSGRLVRRFADVCLSQWPRVAAKYSNVEYVGELL